MVNVRIENVYKYYSSMDDVAAVHDLSMDIKDGEFVAILGPSGCGKSSTMRMISGLEHISAGTISFGDTVVNELAPKDRDIAMVFENYALYPHKSVFDNIANPLKLAKVASHEITERVRKATELLEIDHLLDRRPQELSGGQKQRVAIGRAIVRQPQVYLFDEPIAHLDAKLRARMRSELKRLQVDLGVTSLYVTHDQLEALSMADRVAVMHEGILQQYDTPKMIYEKPANAWVATFVGEPQMSLLECVIRQKGGSVVLDFQGHEIEVGKEVAKVLAASKEQNVLAGFRPNHVSVGGDKVAGSIAGSIYARQLLGGEILAETQVNDTMIRARVPTDFPLQLEDKCFVSFSKDDLNVFSADTGVAIY
jgi:multiple sugar transport system ATP-binding protein